MEGWIKIHRKIIDNPLWFSEKFTRGQAWIDLILLANHADSYFFKRGVKINVSRGQLSRSSVELGHRWKWSRSKVNKFLNDLEKEQQIKQQKSNVNLIVTIINYDLYQQKEQQIEQQKDSKKTAKRQQKDTYKNDKNVGNEKEEENNNSDLFNQFVLIFNSITNRDYKGDKRSKSQFNQRIKEKFSLLEFEIAIKNASNDNYLTENNYLTPEYITRSDKLQKWLNYKDLKLQDSKQPEYQLPILKPL